METVIVEVLFVAFATVNIIFGALVLFSDRVLSFLERTIWKQTDEERKMLPDSYAHLINRYATGLGALLLGIAMLFLYFKFLA